MTDLIRRAVWVSVLLFPPAIQADFNYRDFRVVDGLNLIGSAIQTGVRLQLTAASTNQTGAVWHLEPQPIAAGFDTQFRFQIAPNGPGADGFSFTIQNDSPDAIGDGGGSLGYGNLGCTGTTGGITHSVAVEFDTWQNGCFNEFDDNHLSVHSLGDQPNSAHEDASLDATASIPDLSDLEFHTVRITYEPGTLRIFIDDLDDPQLTVAVDLPSLVGADTAWVGFTGATGGETQIQLLASWSFQSGAPFRRGDANGDGSVIGLVDSLFDLNFQFVPGSPAPPCWDAADADDDGTVSGLVDGLFILAYQFQPGGLPPPAPGPRLCGTDPTSDTLGCQSAGCP